MTTDLQQIDLGQQTQMLEEACRHVTLMEMLQVFSRLENHVSPEKPGRSN
jgi:hypothetical protein